MDSITWGTGLYLTIYLTLLVPCMLVNLYSALRSWKAVQNFRLLHLDMVKVLDEVEKRGVFCEVSVSTLNGVRSIAINGKPSSKPLH